MLPVTRANLEYICCICMQEIRPNVYKEKSYDVCMDNSLIMHLKLTSHISVLKNPRNISQIKEYCKKLCTLCYNKVEFAFEERERILTSCIVLKEIVENDDLAEIMIERLKWICRTCLRRQDTTNEVPITSEIVGFIKDCTGLRYSSYRESAMFRLKEGTNITELLEVDDNKFPGQLCRFCYKRLMNMNDLRKQATASFDDMFNIIGEIEKYETPNPQPEREQTEHLIEESIPIMYEKFENVLLTENSKKEDDQNREFNLTPVKTEYDFEEEFVMIDASESELKNEDYELEDTRDDGDEIDEFNNNDDVFNETSSSSASSLNDEILNVTKKSLESNESQQCNTDTNYDLKTESSTAADFERKPVLQCIICEKVLRNQKSFETHKLKHEKLENETDEKSKLQCQHCPKMFKTKGKLIAHQKKVHNQIKIEEVDEEKVVTTKLKCDICSKRFRDQKLLDVHKYQHEEGRDDKFPFKCEICLKAYRSNGSLQRHQKEFHSGESQEKVSCPICGIQITQKHYLPHHIAAVHEKKKPYNCDYCENTFATAEGKRIHEYIHTNTFSFTCDVCGKLFRQSSKLKTHMEIHVTDPELLCQLCKRGQPSKEALEKHLKDHKNKFFQCPYCGKFFRQKHHSVDHQNAVHLKLKPFKCDYCDQAFGDRKSRRTHEKQHANDAQHKCGMCDLGFKGAQALTRHKRKLNHFAEGEDPSAKKKYKKPKKLPALTNFGNTFLLEYLPNAILSGEIPANRIV